MNNILQNKVIEIANYYKGQEEISGNKGFKSKDFERKMKSVGWLTGQAWCAYFTELVWKESFNACGLQNWIPTLDKLFSGSVVQSFRNFRSDNKTFSISSVPIPGALVFWQSTSNPAQGHAAICVSVNSDGTFMTIEGNTNDVGGREGYIVAQKKRTINSKSLKLLGFVIFNN